jgi:hypothetical protein
MLTCRHCNTEKPQTEFYVSSNTKCKECIKTNVRANREKNIEKYREYDRQRNMNPDRVQARKEYIRTERGKAVKKKSMQNYHERYPMKYAAHVMFRNAVRDKRVPLVTVCSECSSTNKVEGHHDDYTKPFDVRWLCEKCHKEWHKHNEPIYF